MLPSGERLHRSVDGLADHGPGLLALVVLSDLFSFAAAVASVLLGFGPTLPTRAQLIVLVAGNLTAVAVLAVAYENAVDSVLLFDPPGRESLLAIPLGVVSVVAVTVAADPSAFAAPAASSSLSGASPLFQAQMFLVLVVMFPLVEEIFFRGLLFGYLLDYSESVLLAAALSALAFGLIHLEYGAVGVASRTAASLVYVLQRVRYDRLTESWLTHSLYNAVVFLGLVGVPSPIGAL